MNHLTQPNPKSTKHTALYVAVNKLIGKYNTQFGFIDHTREEKFPIRDKKEIEECNSVIKQFNSTFPKEKKVDLIPQPDEPKEKEIIEPWCCDMGKEKDCKCKCHKPHWESDYAAIWERYYVNGDYRTVDLRQDILELIRKIAK